MIGIGDYDGKNRKRREVITREGQVMFNGKKYSLEPSTRLFNMHFWET